MSTSWEDIAAEHGQMVIQAAMRILGRSADAEDVAQEVFFEAFSSATGDVRNWGAYLRKLAVFRAIDRRRQRRKGRSLSLDTLPSNGFSPHDHVVLQELAEHLRTLVASLPDREGAVFALRYFEQLSNPEIAKVLGISIGAVAAAVHRAHLKLQSTLAMHAQGDAK